MAESGNSSSECHGTLLCLQAHIQKSSIPCGSCRDVMTASVCAEAVLLLSVFVCVTAAVCGQGRWGHLVEGWERCLVLSVLFPMFVLQEVCWWSTAWHTQLT
jgi:hypothetical protein